jgi:hypothetical protein
MVVGGKFIATFTYRDMLFCSFSTLAPVGSLERCSLKMGCILHYFDYLGSAVPGLVWLLWLTTKEAVVRCMLLAQGFLYILDSVPQLALSQRTIIT